MKLSIIVPVYNEARRLTQVLEYLLNSNIPFDKEWIFVDDGSTDESPGILRQQQLKYGYQLCLKPQNQGKGAAIATGIAQASGDIIVIQDADFEYDPNELGKLIEPIVSNRADVVYGSRFKSSVQVHRTYHYFVNHTLTMLSNLLSGIYLSDMETCYKVFRAELLKAMKLRSSRFGIEVELTAYVAKTAARINELPIRYNPRTRLHGKKINWKDGVAALFHLIRFNCLTPFAEAFSESLPTRYLPDPTRAPVPLKAVESEAHAIPRVDPNT